MAKNNKKSKQKKSVLNKLGGLSKRSKFIVVVLIFAVLGGGYLTYKSFAMTTQIDSKAAADTGHLGNGAYVKTETLESTGKSGTRVVALRGKGSNVEYMGAPGLTVESQRYRFCFTARVEGSIAFGDLKTTVTRFTADADPRYYSLGGYRSNAAELQRVNLLNPNAYAQYCSGRFSGNSTVWNYHGNPATKDIHFKIENTTYYGGTVLISQIYLHRCLDTYCSIGSEPAPAGK